MEDNEEIVTGGADDSLETVPTADERTPKDEQGAPRRAIPRRVALIALGLVLLLVIGAIIFGITHKPSKKTTQTVVINTQSLDNGTLNKLTTKTGTTGAVQQLTISPSTLFKSDVAIQGATTLDGNLTVKGTSNLIGAVATGSNLTVGGGLALARNASIGGNLSVSGSIAAGSLNVGSINLSTLSLSGNLSLGGHLLTTGTVPTIAPSAAAGGGTAIISGNDTSGTITLTIGSGPLVNGELAIITFHTPYSLTPKVQLTPATNDAALLPYFVTQSPVLFTIRSAATPTAHATYTFNYLVTQ